MYVPNNLEKKVWVYEYRFGGKKYNIYALCFSDGQIVLAQNADDIKYVAFKLTEKYGRWRLEVNTKDSIQKVLVWTMDRRLDVATPKNISECPCRKTVPWTKSYEQEHWSWKSQYT